MSSEANYRYAVVSSLTWQQADALLPDNYRLLGDAGDGRCVITGTDVKHWTLDNDVLPRLATADCVGYEISEAEARSLLQAQ